MGVLKLNMIISFNSVEELSQVLPYTNHEHCDGVMLRNLLLPCESYLYITIGTTGVVW